MGEKRTNILFGLQIKKVPVVDEIPWPVEYIIGQLIYFNNRWFMKISIDRIDRSNIKEANEVITIAFNTSENRMEDLQRLLILQPDGWFMAFEDGIPVGTVGAVDYGAFAWIGMMTVLPAKQGHGLGKLLMQHLIDWLDERGSRLALLDATPFGEPLYQRFSFREMDRVNQYVRTVPPSTVDPNQTRSDGFPNLSLPDGMRRLAESDIPLIAEFDRDIFGADRRAVLDVYYRDYPKRGFVAFDPSGKLNGYLLVQSRKIGPWIAVSEDVAACLLQAALGLDFPEGSPTAITPASNNGAQSILERNGFQILKSLSHMQRGEPTSSIHRELIYGQTSFALG